MKQLFQKYKSSILYIVFGGLTTCVDWVVSFSLYYLWSDGIATTPALLHVADAIAWVAAVAVSYVTNRIWVFESKRKGFVPILCEIFAFAGGRVLTFFLQEAIMGVFCTWLGLNAYLFKVIAAVIVLVSNYVISKLFVFKSKKQDQA